MSENIKQHENEEGGRFAYEDEGKDIGGMYYHYEDNKMIIDHTEVIDGYEGKGIARQLLESLVLFVRDKKIKVIPHCSYAAVTFKRVKEWQDVLAG